MSGMTPGKEGTQAVGRSFDKYEREPLINSMAAVVWDGQASQDINTEAPL